MLRRRPGLLAALAASLVLHGVLSLVALRYVPRTADEPGVTVEMELTTESSHDEALPDVIAASQPAPAPAATLRSEHVAHERRLTAPTITLTAIPTVASPTPATALDTIPSTSTAAVCTVRCDAGIPSLDPSAVALAAVGADERIAAAANASGATASDDLSRYLGGVANAHPWESHRAPPELHRSADGSYVYSSGRLSARIAPDGTVAFGDRPGVSIDGPASSAGLGVAGTFDIGEAVMEANGQDPLRAERDWFMRGTASLRSRLDARARHADGESSLQALDGRLAAIVADHHLSPATQRARVFAAWDDCETDAIGARAREHITAFAREHFPAGSALAYTGSELAAFNAHRVSRERFAPYG